MYGGLNNVEAANGGARIDYSCTTTIGSQLDLAVNYGFSLPDSVEAGEQFQLDNFTAQVVISPQATSLLKGVANPLNGSVSTLNIELEGANVASLNLAQQNIPIPETAIDPAATEATFTVASPVAVGPLTASKSSDNVKVKSGDIITELNTLVGQIKISCSPAGGKDVTLATMAINKQVEPEPVEPEPVEPEPVEPEPVEPEPVEPEPVEPEPVEPEPVEPEPVEPAPVEPSPVEPVDPVEPTEPNDQTPTPEEPQKPTDPKGQVDNEKDGEKNVVTTIDKDKGPAKNSKVGDGGKLPNTASTMPSKILFGAILILAGGVVHFFRRKVA